MTFETKRLWTLIKLNIKRAYQSLFSLIFGAIALTFLVSAIAFCGNEFLYGNSTKVDSDSPINIAVTLYDDSVLANSISQGITSNQQISEAISFNFIKEAEAIKGLKNGTYIAAIIIAENTIDSILNGTNTPIQVVFPKNSGLEAIVIKEIADAAATLLSSAQAGIYSIYDIYEAHGADAQIDGALLRMNLKYISFVVNGAKMFDVHQVAATGSISMASYYICGGLVLFMMLLCINCYSFTDRLPATASMRMSLNGTPFILQEITSYLAILLAQLATLFIIILPAIPILGMFSISIPADRLGYLLLILPTFSVVSSAFTYAVSRLTFHNLGRIMISFVAIMAMCFVSGCFIPTLMLPDILLHISRFTPTSHMMNMAASAMSGQFDTMSMTLCIISAFMLISIGIIASHLHLRKELR